MRKMWSTAKYRLICYWKGYTFVMPLIVICAFMGMMYSVKPMDVVSGYLITVYFLFFLMVWIGMTETNRENRVMEQILELRVHKTCAYFGGRLLLLFFLSLFAACLCTVWPFLKNVMEKGTFFNRPYLPADFINSFLLNLGSAYSGAVIGSFLHPDLCRDRRTAISLTALLSMLAALQGMIVNVKPVLKYVLWILPDISFAAVRYGNEEYFKISISLEYFFMLVDYATVYGVIGSFWQYRKRA